MRKRLVIKSKLRFFTFILVSVLILTGSCGFVSAKCTAAPQSEYVTIDVLPGDTLWDIACEHVTTGTDVREYIYDICTLNEITADQLYSGMTLMIPTDK